jgi:hypothetical protein
MARDKEREGELRGCPVCGTKVSEVDIGLRDYRWVNPALGNRLGLMDLDACLSQASTGRALFLELKPKGAFVSTGARLTFALLVKAGFDVWILWDQGNGRIKRGVCDENGRPKNVREHRADNVARMVARWWEQGLAD